MYNLNLMSSLCVVYVHIIWLMVSDITAGIALYQKELYFSSLIRSNWKMGNNLTIVRKGISWSNIGLRSHLTQDKLINMINGIFTICVHVYVHACTCICVDVHVHVPEDTFQSSVFRKNLENDLIWLFSLVCTV